MSPEAPGPSHPVEPRAAHPQTPVVAQDQAVGATAGHQTDEWKEPRMTKFGTHTPTGTHQRKTQSAMAVFTRGLQVGGQRWTFDFPNGYGASVISDGYGGDEGLYELAVLQDAAITYDTPLTDDVLGWLPEADVAEALDKIAALESVTA